MMALTPAASLLATASSCETTLFTLSASSVSRAITCSIQSSNSEKPWSPSAPAILVCIILARLRRALLLRKRHLSLAWHAEAWQHPLCQNTNMSIQPASHVQHRHRWLDPKTAQSTVAPAGLGSAESARRVAYHHSGFCFFGGHLQLGLQGNELLLHVSDAALCCGQLLQTHLVPFLHRHHLSTA